MKAFKVNMQDLFLMNGYDSEGNKTFDDSKKKLLIPKYQREYGWKDEKVKDLLADVAEHEKFLGFLILNEKDNHYEIVDGQQRLTTCFLILLSLYNAYENQPLERSDIKQIIRPVDDQIIFENESVGHFIKENGDVFQIEIDKDNDKYFQEESFKRVFSIVNEKITNCKEQGTLRDFKSKFLECNFLILLNTLSDRSLSVEQLFLDVNEKTQPLEPEDIFKGYCFEKFSENHHELLKEKWVKLKELSFVFKNSYGYKDTSDYLYLYLLSKNKDIDSKLTLSGEHYLKQKEMDDVNKLLDEMIQYGEKITNLAKNINRTDYYFEDICLDSEKYKNTSDFIAMKDMSKWLIEGSNSTTQKVPFFYFVSCQEKYRDSIIHQDLRAIITNLYIYAYLFTLEKRKKGKKDLDTSLIEYLCNGEICGGRIKELSKTLRVEKVGTFELPETKQFAILSFIYSIIDNYSSNDNFIKKIYKYIDANTGENLEHFVVPDKREGAIQWTWINGKNEFRIGGKLASQYKAFTTNYVILNTQLNGELHNYDIVKKIEMIKAHYNKNLPKHIALYIDFIENLESYISLKALTAEDVLLEDVKKAYLEFLKEYFDHETQYRISDVIVDAFKKAFTNNVG